MLQFPHLHLDNTHIVSTKLEIRGRENARQKKGKYLHRSFCAEKNKTNNYRLLRCLQIGPLFKSSLSLVFCRHLHAFGSSMSILCRPVGRQHKQQLRHRSKLVMNSADIRVTRPVRLLSRIHGRIKLISESSESKLTSESDEIEDIVKFFRILSTMEPKRNNFRCRKPSKDTEEQSYDREYLGVVLHLTSQPCSTQISYTRS